MQAVEIVLIVVGVLCICISFFVSKKKSDAADTGEVPRGAEIRTEKDEEVIIKHIDEILEKYGFAENAYEQFKVLKEELKAFHPKLAEKNFVVALNKSDLGIENAIKEFKKHRQKVVITSAITGEGCSELQQALDAAVPHIHKKSIGWSKKG